MRGIINRKEIKRLLKEKFPQAVAVRFECLRIKGGAGMGKVRLKFANGEIKKVWIKINRFFFIDQERGRQLGKDCYEFLIKLYNSFTGEDNLSIVRPLSYISNWGAIITEDVPGVSLHKIIYRYTSGLNRLFFINNKNTENTLFNCGQWLAKFQEFTPLNKEIRGVELDFLQETNIERDLFRLEQVGVAKDTIDRLRQYFFEYLLLIKNLFFKSVGCHVDFAPRNILVSEKGEIVGLDFDDFSYRWPHDNVAMFMAYLDTMAKYPFVDRHKLSKLKGLFLEGYQKRAKFTIDDKTLHFLQVRYIASMVANEISFVRKRKGIFRWIILKRMAYLLERWVNENIIQNKQKVGGFNSEQALAPWIHGVDRGKKMIGFLNCKIGPLEQKKVLDVGCGGGGISIAFAERCKEVTALDSKVENINLLRQRIIERNLKTIHPLLGNALYLPFSEGTFDIVIINGVLEWVGYGEKEDPFLLQVKALDGALRVLRKGGVLYLAIENRWYPFNTLRDPHIRIPLVTIMPRRIASWISSFLTGRPYETPIYSYWKLKDMLNNRGFSKMSVYAALIHYQYPVVIVDLEKGRYHLSNREIDMINSEYKKMKLTKGLRIKLLFLKLIFLLGIPKIFVHNFIALAYKNNSLTHGNN